MAKRMYYGGTVLTMEDILYAQALLVEDGVIRAVGSEAEVRAAAGRDCEMVDLKGHTLMPAFIDAHSHFSGCANSLLQVPLGEAVSFDEIEERIAAFIRDNHISKGQWVAAQGFDHNVLREKRPPRREVLDRAAPDNPVIMAHQSGHTGVLNTLALERLGITPDTPVPEGGMMEVADGKVTGYMEETAFLNCQSRVPMPAPEDLMGAYLRAQDGYARRGVTTVQEGMMIPAMEPLYRQLCAAGLLKLDVVGYLDITQVDGMRTALSEHIGQYSGRFKVGGYKTFLDGSPQARTAWLREPYCGAEENYRGYPRMSNEELAGYVDRALDENMQLLVHCNGDAACEQYLRVYGERLRARAASGKPCRAIRPVIIHAQMLAPDQLSRAAQNGMIPSFFVAHVYHWGDVHLGNLGPERAARISPAASAGAQGLRYTFHQDAPVIQPDMLETVWCAVNRVTKQGTVLGPQERVPVLDALRAVTINAAYQYFEEGSKGSLRPGKRADLVILEEDPLKALPMHLRDIRILETVKDGKTIYRTDI